MRKIYQMVSQRGGFYSPLHHFLYIQADLHRVVYYYEIILSKENNRENEKIGSY